MFDAQVYFAALAALVAIGVGGWLVSLVKQDVSFVDSLWSLFFLIAAIVYFVPYSPTARGYLVLTLVTAWALRLSIYITWRNWGEPEDARYRAIRANNEPFALKSLYIVFGLQAALAWIVSLPLHGAILSANPIGVLDILGAALWAVGLFFEAVGDFQLARFKADPANRGKVLDSGLWRYTRHPNYFGDFCVWWGFYLIALSGGAWWSIVGPVLMSILLLRVSGVALLEKDITERRPAYRDYIERTNAFFPGRPAETAEAG